MSKRNIAHGDCDEDAYEEAELPGVLMCRAQLDDTECSTLMTMNDGDEEGPGQPFSVIADYIERHL